MSSERIIIAVLGINLIFALIFLIWGVAVVPVTGLKKYIPGGKRRYIILFVVFIMCPVVSMAGYVLALLFNKVFFHKEVDLTDVIFSKERTETYDRADESRELNITSFEEAIAVSDYKSLRELMLNVLRGDIKKSLASISLALNSQDSETSHYAATALRDELASFRETAQKIYIEIQKRDKNLSKYCCMELEYMNTVLEQHVLVPMEQKKYVLMLEETGNILYTADKAGMKDEYYEWICMHLIYIDDYEKAEKWCEIIMKECPGILAPYKCRLKLYYKLKDREKFFVAMDELRKSQVVIDKETLEIIRIFNE